MNLLEIVQRMGFNPIKTSLTHGGEFHLPCPGCGGTDRFMVWPNKGVDRTGTYYCRRCEASGDAVKFLMDFQNLSYKEACLVLSRPMQNAYSKILSSRNRYTPSCALLPTSAWSIHASLFLNDCHKQILSCSHGLSMLQERGISESSIKKWKLGWNHQDRWDLLKNWGSSDHPDQKVWLPKGLVIPSYDLTFQELIKLKIRRTSWVPGDQFPKYVEIKGGSQGLSVYGDTRLKKAIVVESELDAILLQEKIQDLAFCIALGGCSKRPDTLTDKLLRKVKLVLISLDMDDAGRKAYGWWKKTYHNSRAWPVPDCKSPGDAYLAGIDLRAWIET